MAAHDLTFETRADGSGEVVPTQLLRSGETLTLYAISRLPNGTFVENVAADSWTLEDATGDVQLIDLDAAMDSKSAVFTADEDGTAVVHATYTDTPDLITADSGTIFVLDSAIVSLDDAKEYLGETTTANDDLFLNWIKRVTGMVEGALNQAIYPRTVTETVDGSGNTIQYTKLGRIQNIVGDIESTILGNLQQRTGPQESWTDLLTDTDFLFIEGGTWVIELLGGNIFPSGQKNIRIQYKAGFAIGSSDLQTLQNLALEMLQIMWNKAKKGDDMLGKVTRNVGEGGMSINVSLKDMGSEWQKTIDAYKRNPY